MKRGEVYRYNYLWGHEAERGEESGRKIRRVCLMMEVNGWLYLFPISSRVPRPAEPGTERIYEIIPETERRRVGLGADKTSHLVLDDYNRVRPDELYDFESTTPVGTFSSRFLEKVARRFLEAMRERRPIAGLSRR
ncbi:hypothetical protein EJC49_17475 [Aquibium carbonis]|uniref:Type II toxin-antitoxin system PemK/MazF family toxin n=1 Tax=Aquibium carbonis TaxID=2495581 RepID=A0A429YUD8_9HYPH|nr:hypothetical protein [Aquibium carbonis]RST85067.1 hypothetical protein EJC49_17475 [Aquibium carbonis]